MHVSSDHASPELLGALSRLHGDAASATFPFEVEGSDEVREKRTALLEQLSDYILPRLVQLEAPLLVVVGGSTGAGKSTLVSSLVGERVTESGVLRPTTRSPVLVHHPDEAKWFAPDRVLPELPRTTEAGNATYALRLVASDKMPRGLAILDAPDVDSIDAGNRELASQLLAAADLWLFVTSAARYADQVPWDYLRAAAERSAAVAVVLDRTHPDSINEVRGHLARMMTSRGLSDSPLFTIDESPLDVDGLLPREKVTGMLGWLRDLADDPAARAEVVSRTLDGAVRLNVFRGFDLVDGLDAQVAVGRRLTGAGERAYDEAARKVADAVADGSLLVGPLGARWDDYVGSGEVLASVEQRVGRIRDRFIEGVTGKRTRAAEVTEAVVSALTVVLTGAVESAARTTAAAWDAEPAGRVVVEAHRGIDRASREAAPAAERAVRDWQQVVLDTVKTEGADKRLSAKFLAFGADGVALSAMIVALAGPSGRDQVARRVLDSILGPEQAGRVVERARADLDARVRRYVDAERDRQLRVLPSVTELEAVRARLSESARGAEHARHLDFLGDDA